MLCIANKLPKHDDNDDDDDGTTKEKDQPTPVHSSFLRASIS